MKFKEDVSIRGLREEMYFAIKQVERAAKAIDNTYEPTITSAVDGKHSPNSLHYDGRAIDIRIHDLRKLIVPIFIEEIKERLPSDFDVVLEPDHIHIEWQPKYQS